MGNIELLYKQKNTFLSNPPMRRNIVDHVVLLLVVRRGVELRNFRMWKEPDPYFKYRPDFHPQGIVTEQ